MLAEAKRRGPASEGFVNAARTQIAVITNDGSLGFHNFDKAQRMIATARILAKRGLGVPTAAGWRRQQAATPPKVPAPVTSAPATPLPATPKAGPAPTPGKPQQGASLPAQ